MTRKKKGTTVLYDDGAVRLTDLGNARGSDGGGILSRRVVLLTYEHVEDGPDTERVHDFAPGVSLVALPGMKAILMFRPDGRPLARDY